MAITTCQFGVFAFERKISIAGMIETGVVPVSRVVAIFTLLTAAAVMRIIFLVAREAIGRRVRECLILVAVQARCLLVLSD